MSEKTMYVKYEDGPAELEVPSLGISAERGFAIPVPQDVGKQLIAQGWLLSKASEVKPDPKESKPSAPSPAAKKKADELGVDIDTVVGTGSKGNITVKDVEGAAKVAAQSTPPAEPEDAETSEPNQADPAASEQE